MRLEPEARPASIRRRRGGAIGARSRPRHHCREIRVAMFEPTSAGPKQQQEHVFLVRQKAPEAVAFLDERLQIARRPIAVPPIGVAGADDKVLLARHIEGTDGQLPCHDRRIHERLVIGGAKLIRPTTRRAVEPSHRRRPARWQLDLHVVRALGVLRERDESGRAVEHTVVGVDVIRGHRALIAEHAVGELDEAFAACADAPVIALRLLDDERLAVERLRAQVAYVRRVIFEAVVARRPRRHHQVERWVPGRRHSRLHDDLVRARSRDADGIRDWLESLGHGPLRADDGQRDERQHRHRAAKRQMDHADTLTAISAPYELRSVARI